MDFRMPRLRSTAALLTFLAGFINAQVPSARTILDTSEAEQMKFVNETIAAGFPGDRADQMTMLIINRSAVTLPLIAGKLEEALKSTSTPKSFVDTASEMIAYAGDEQSLRALSKLISFDERRFGWLIGRTLDNAGNWRNPFTVAYRGLEMGDEAVSRYTAAWAEAVLTSERMQRVWADAMLDRYGKVVPSETEWAQDPIASRLKDRASPELRQSVVRFAAEAQSKRQRP
jgi:hypothetical protein